MRKNNHAKFLILGAGVAGLGAGIALRKAGEKSLILEKDNTPGGLNKSLTVHGCNFDFGPKILLLDKSKNSKDVLSFLKGNYKKYPVVERTYLSEFGLLGFPLQRHLIDLPEKEKDKILNSLKISRSNPLDVYSFRDWLINGYGEYFCNKILFPYAEKKWQMSLDRMDYKWALSRPIKVGCNEIIKGSKKRLPPNKYYFYPKAGNISILTSAMAREAGNILLTCKVTEINLKEKYVITSKGKFYFEYLISSLPLDYVNQITVNLPEKLKEVANNTFKRLGILIFNLVFDGKHELDGTAIYYPEKKFCFRRVSILQNLCPALGRPNLTPISVELSITQNKEIDEIDIFKKILFDFSQINGLRDLGKPVDWKVLKVDFAYPLQMKGLRKRVKEFQDYYAKFNAYHCGRGGNLDYCNSDQAYKQGKEIVDKIFYRKN